MNNVARNYHEICEIKKEISNPISVKDFISNEDIDHLISIFDSAEIQNKPYQGKILKNTGPITLDLFHYYDDPIVKNVIDELKTIIGNFEITAAFFFRTDYPHVIHNDDTIELPSNVYKGITLPLKLYGEFIKEYPKLCFFDQFYFQGPAKFFNNDQDIPTYYNKQIYKYSEVEGLVDNEFDKVLYEKYFTHLRPKWLDRLSIHSMLDWIPGDALIFDSVRLHCASDFRKLGIKAKLGISIFTKKIS